MGREFLPGVLGQERGSLLGEQGLVLGLWWLGPGEEAGEQKSWSGQGQAGQVQRRSSAQALG